jgi:hypothetical protein
MRALNIAELSLFRLTVERLDDVHTAHQITEEQYTFCRHPAAGMILKLSGIVRLCNKRRACSPNPCPLETRPLLPRKLNS